MCFSSTRLWYTHVHTHTTGKSLSQLVKEPSHQRQYFLFKHKTNLKSSLPRCTIHAANWVTQSSVSCRVPWSFPMHVPALPPGQSREHPTREPCQHSGTFLLRLPGALHGRPPLTSITLSVLELYSAGTTMCTILCPVSFLQHNLCKVELCCCNISALSFCHRELSRWLGGPLSREGWEHTRAHGCERPWVGRLEP